MLEVLNKFICSSIMSVVSLYGIRKIIGYRYKISFSEIAYLILLTTISVVLHPVQYTPIYTITIFLLNIIIFKKMFKLTFEQSTIASGIFMFTLFISDIVIATIFRLFYTTDQIRTNFIVSIMANLSISILSICVLESKLFYSKFRSFYNNYKDKKLLVNIIFIVFLIIGFSYIAYNYATYKINHISYFTNSVIMIVFTIITYIFIENKNSYNQLSREYDTLFAYIQNFEDWIEKEQLNRHEYKNQLAVIKSITRDKKVKTKINEILEDNINIEGDVVHKLKELPKGGLKGLMYYKVAIAQKSKNKVEVDVSLKKKNVLKELTEDKMKILCNLLGIYFDNAIEAASETKKKSISLEIYTINNNVHIVISNTFKEHDNFAKRNEQGVSSKGEGHGNGLYYANNLLTKNKWLEAKQEVIDDYYIQTLKIKN